MKPRLFTIPAADPVPLTGSEGNILRRCQYAPHPDEYQALLDQVSPARHTLGNGALDALERYVFNRVGPLFPTYNDIAQRDHFLPHTGLWAPIRRFDDPRVMTQLWLHTAAHEWFGWPLPVGTTFGLYQKASFESEILAVLESEFLFFKNGSEATAGMFNPAYPSTYEALQAVGVTDYYGALSLLRAIQFNGGRLPRSVTGHSGYKGGVAVTLQRQAAWPEHDEAFTIKQWTFQRQEGYLRAYTTLWTPDRHKAIFARQQQGHDGIAYYQDDYDATEGLRAVVKSMLRVMSLDVVQHAGVDQDAAFGRIAGMFATVMNASSHDRLLNMLINMPDVYDTILGEDAVQYPAPLWSLACDFREFRVAWEERLKEKTAYWTAKE